MTPINVVSGSVAYAYDSVGNRTSRTSTGSLTSALPTDTYTYDTNDEVATDTHGTSPAFDADNNMKNWGSADTWYYDDLNRLTSDNNYTYCYDGDNIRYGRSGGQSIFYVVDDVNPSGYSQVLEEFTQYGTAGALTRVYNYGSSLISQQQFDSSTLLPSVLSYYGYDGHGSVRFLTATNGTITDTYTYDAFGTMLFQNGTTPNNYLYCAQQFDPGLGLYYNRNRYNLTDVGRFTSMDGDYGNNEDPLSLHKYLYAEGDPVDTEDPSGNASSFSAADAAAIGRQVHTFVGQDFVQNVRGGVTAKSVFSFFGLPTGPSPFKKLGQKLGRIFPDLVDVPNKEVYEIKPVSLSGTAIGLIQLGLYIKLFNHLDPRGGWHGGNTYAYNKGLIALASPPSVVIVLPPALPPASGMIYYEPFTIQQLGQAGVKVDTKGNTASLQQMVGISSMLGVLGGI